MGSQRDTTEWLSTLACNLLNIWIRVSFGLPWLSWKLPEGRDLFCPLSTAFLIPRKVPDSKPSLNQELLNETVKLGLDTGLSDAKTEHWTHPLQFFPPAVLTQPPGVMMHRTNYSSLLEIYQVSANSSQGPFFVFSAMPHPAQLYLR